MFLTKQISNPKKFKRSLYFGTHQVWVHHEKFKIDFLSPFFPYFYTYIGRPKKILVQLTTFVSNLVFSSQCIAFHALQSALNFHSSGLRGKTFSTIRFNLLSIYFNHVQVEYNMRPGISTIGICIQTNIFLNFYKYLFVFLKNILLYFYEFCKVSSLVSGVRRSPNPDEPTNTANLIW